MEYNPDISLANGWYSRNIVFKKSNMIFSKTVVSTYLYINLKEDMTCSKACRQELGFYNWQWSRLDWQINATVSSVFLSCHKIEPWLWTMPSFPHELITVLRIIMGCWCHGLQLVQNAAAPSAHRQSQTGSHHTNLIFITLATNPISYWLQNCFSCVNNVAPQYLSDRILL